MKNYSTTLSVVLAAATNTTMHAWTGNPIFAGLAVGTALLTLLLVADDLKTTIDKHE